MFSSFNFSNPLFCCAYPCSHIHEQVNIYVSQFMYIQYMTSDLFPFLTVFGLFVFTAPFLYRSKYQSVSPCIYNTTSDLFRYRPFFFFLEGLLLLFAVCCVLIIRMPTVFFAPFVSDSLPHLRFSRRSVFVCKVTEQRHCTRSVLLSSVKIDENFPQSQITAFHKISSLISCLSSFHSPFEMAHKNSPFWRSRKTLNKRE